MSDALEQNRASYTELKTYTINEIYGDGWWERNREELNRRFDWIFRYAVSGDRILTIETGVRLSDPVRWTRSANPLIVILAEKPQPPTLRDIYGVDEVVIPAGWEWTGEFRVPVKGDNFLSGGDGTYSNTVHTCDVPQWYGTRLILRKRQPKVWFKAEEEERCPQKGDWFWSHLDHIWVLADMIYQCETYICATRHEEPDNTVQTVTQADIDRLQKVNS